ncbi:hemagglutinin repeat-containing protein [Acetonema longum]|uniref:Filamentous hemagglutinin family outer membrane protein n=1 Tax=Acetonema longum DSM 6540 TaxID=1009370 RepID=F7NML2_9FIRM|nr:hemagglutinin repeat-containing protein [Acetonema longum]EGO62720.1 filamentous hemagglutinin family outer membrane protein [Acetonema longum DSM 6540]
MHLASPLITKKLKKIVAWLTLAFYLGQPTLSLAQVVADPQAGKNRPIIDTAANGVSVVQITTPSAAGVSRNQYTHFNVPTNGLILNNSAAITQTQLGGYISGNSSIGNRPARIILNEVTSANPSHLRGYTEVAGQRADVIIANPNGIVGNGFGFINTSRAVLTTGVPVFGGSGSLEAFRVSRGQIRIEGQGLDASTTDRLDILSRAATINAGIWAQELNLVTGANQIRYDTLATQKISGEDSQPQVALDVGLLGGMYANKIRLIGTEQGVGVNSQGNLSATSGDIRVTQTGKVILAGHTGATGQIQIQTDDSFTNQGTLHAGGDAQIHTGQDIRNTGSLTAGGHFTLAGATLQSSGTIAAGLTTAGNIGDTGDLTITVSVADLSGAKTYAGGNADFAIQNTLDTSDAILQANGHLNIQAQQILNSHGTLAAGRNLTLNTPDGLDNTQGFLYAGQNLTLNPTAYLTNIQGQIGAGHDLWTETQRFTNTGGLLAANNNLTFTTQGTLTNQGVMKATGALFLNAVSIHNQQDGLLNAGAIQLTADTDIANQGRIDGGLTQTTSQTFTNTGIFFSDNLIIKANHIHNTGEEAIIGATGNAWYFAGSLLENKDGAILYGQGDLIVAADEEQDANGFYTHLTGNILNQSATIESDGNIGLFAQKITNKKREFAVEQQEVSRTTKTEDIPYSAPYYKASRTYTEVVTETVVTKDSDPGQILAGGNMILRGSIENNVSTITAGGHLDFDSDRLTNISYANTRIITQAGTSSYTRRERYCKHKIMGSCVDHSHRDVTDRDPVNEQFSENISGYASIISGNQSISGVVGSIDNLTLGVDNAPVGGMASTLLGQTTGSAGSDNPSGYTFRIPANSLYATHTDPNAKYLVEINPRFTEKNQFLGSDYMLERIATDPASVQKRLGDGYYEQKLIRDQLTLLTGRQFLDNYTSSEEQYKALLDNGIAAAETFHLTVGVALTPEQIQALTQDIVWMVEQEIQGQKVWVPVVYLAGARDMELRPDGALIAAKEIDITTTGNLTNSGSIKADKLLLNVQNLTNRGGLLSGADTLQITATNNILNQSGRIAGGDLLLSAGGDIKNETLTTTLTAEQASPQPAKGLSTRFGIGQQTASNSEHTTTLVHQAGSIEATGNLTLTAGQDISMNGAQAVAGQNLTLSAGRNLELDTVEHHEQYSVDSRKYKAEYDATHHIATSLAAGGDIQLLAQNGATLKGAQIDAGQDLTLAAGNVTVTAVKDHMLDDSNKIGYDGNFRRDRTDDETVQGSKLEAGNNLTIAATHAGDSKKSGQGNVNVAGSYLVTKTDETGVPLGEGNLRILADNQVHIQEMHERHESLKESQTSSGNLLSTTTTYTREHALLNQAKGSTLSGEQVDIQAGQDLTVRGSELGASNDLSLRGETVTIESAQTTFESDSYTYTKKSGLSISFDGGLNVFAGSSKTKTAEAAEGTEQKKSAVGSLNGKVTIEADKDVQIKASDITGKTGIDITGQNVAVEAAADTTHSHNTYQFKQTGFTLTAGNTVVSTATQAVNSVERATQVEDGRLAALHGIKAIETGNQAWQKAQGTDPDTGKPIDPKKDNPAKIKVSLSVGSRQQRNPKAIPIPAHPLAAACNLSSRSTS